VFSSVFLGFMVQTLFMMKDNSPVNFLTSFVHQIDFGFFLVPSFVMSTRRPPFITPALVTAQAHGVSLGKGHITMTVIHADEGYEAEPYCIRVYRTTFIIVRNSIFA
jgi:hypothetical protein